MSFYEVYTVKKVRIANFDIMGRSLAGVELDTLIQTNIYSNRFINKYVLR